MPVQQKITSGYATNDPNEILTRKFTVGRVSGEIDEIFYAGLSMCSPASVDAPTVTSLS